MTSSAAGKTGRIAVVGAGIAGLAAARALTTAGLDVRVFDKSRGLGGRLATRRSPIGRFDHGAQYASVRDPAFAAYADAAVAAGAAAEWSTGGSETHGIETRRIVGLPGMSGLVRPLADGLTIERETRVTGIERDGPNRRLMGETGRIDGVFRAVVCALPAPQAAALLTDHDPAFAALRDVAIAPCWSLMIAFDAPADLPDRARLEDADLGWIAREPAKPGRDAAPERFIVHASPAWSRANLELDKDEAAERLTDLLAAQAGGALPSVTHRAAHRWRFSQVERAVGSPYLLSADGRIGACGDGLTGGRVEAAFLSGRALGLRMAADFA